jgi:hypothetical protein
MVSPLFYYQLALLALIWLFVMLHLGWPGRSAPPPPAPDTPRKPKRSTEPKTCEGLTHKPSCAWCEQDTGETHPVPPVRPDPLPSTNRRPRTVETSMHFCPHTDCAYRGWPGLNNLRANGLPTICQPPFVNFLPPRGYSKISGPYMMGLSGRPRGRITPGWRTSANFQKIQRLSSLPCGEVR